MSDKSDAFAKQVESVVSEFEASLSRQDWSMKRDLKRMRDEIGDVYAVQSLTLINGPVRLLLDPNGYDIPGAEGVMDLYVLPPYNPVATLYLEEGEWFIHSPFPAALNAVNNPTKWTRSCLTKDSISKTLRSIVEHAVPSL